MFVNLRVVDGSFLSTLSLRRATVHSVTLSALAPISIHALLAESDNTVGRIYLHSHISIHALLAESDKPAEIGTNLVNNFYPRSPCGERLASRLTDMSAA